VDRTQDDLDNELKGNIMSNEQQTASAQTRIAAAVMFMLLVAAGYAISPSVESAVDSPMTVAALTPSFDAAGQWTGDENLDQRAGGEEAVQLIAAAEEHIQAY
jgi:hypothetical protein